jgi:hypothetical protein
MRRRTLPILLIVVVAILSLGEAYHFHPEGGARWHVAFPFATPSPTTDTHGSDRNTPATGPTACPLHFWASVLSTVALLLVLLLLPPTSATTLHQAASSRAPSWSGLALSIRGPPTILS